MPTITTTAQDATYGVPVLAVPIGTTRDEEGRWGPIKAPARGFISGVTVDPARVAVQFHEGGPHHVLKASEVDVVAEPSREDLEAALRVAQAAEADLLKRSGWATVPEPVRRRLAREADEAGAAVIYWEQVLGLR